MGGHNIMTNIKRISTEVNIIANAVETKKRGLDKLYVTGLIYDYLSTRCPDKMIYLYAEAMSGNLEDDEFYNTIFKISNDFNQCLWKDELDSKCIEAMNLIMNTSTISDLRTALCCYVSDWDD